MIMSGPRYQYVPRSVTSTVRVTTVDVCGSSSRDQQPYRKGSSCESHLGLRGKHGRQSNNTEEKKEIDELGS